MKRRDFLRATGVFSASLAFAKPGRIFTNDSTHDFTNDQWRTFEVTTRAEVLKPSGGTRIWLPAPLISKSPFQKTLPKALSAEKVKGRNQVQAPSSPIPEPSEQAVAVIARDPSPCTPPDSSSDIELRLPDRKPSLRLPQADGKLPEYGPVQIHHLFREDRRTNTAAGQWQVMKC
jgi:hypothetical protein